MSHLNKNRYRKKLEKYLKSSDEIEFLKLIWGINLIQAGKPESAIHHIRFRKEILDSKLGSNFFIPFWSLETLANERLVAPEQRIVMGEINRIIPCNNFDHIRPFLASLNKLENSEDGLTLKKTDIFDEMRRITSRQFEWQQNELDLFRIYRSFFLFQESKVNDYFIENYGISIHELFLVGIAMYATFLEHHKICHSYKLEAIGINELVFKQAMALISTTILKARSTAREIRQGQQNTAYKRSVFRRYPLIQLPSDNNSIISPIPRLILQRVTTGLTIDLYNAPQILREGIATRFEIYCKNLLSKILTSHQVEPEISYGSSKFQRKSPDVIVSKKCAVEIIIECKSTAQTYDAKFSSKPLQDAKYKIKDLGKGVFQIWRFFSNLRQGVVPNYHSSSNAFGILLCLDDWFTMSRSIIDSIKKDAIKRCDESQETILEMDRKPIVFTSIHNIEKLQRSVDDDKFFRVLRASYSKKYDDWDLYGVYSDLFPENTKLNPFAFEKELENSLWWKEFASSKPTQSL